MVTGTTDSSYKILLHPYVTEKTLNHMEIGNRLEFIVHREASKTEIKNAFEKLYETKVAKVNTRILADGKHAIIKLVEAGKAEEIGMRIGIF
jgi:large subunit ribosomal protein L23